MRRRAGFSLLEKKKYIYISTNTRTAVYYILWAFGSHDGNTRWCPDTAWLQRCVLTCDYGGSRKLDMGILICICNYM